VTHAAASQGTATLTAIKTRADGTVEYLGVIATMSMTEDEMKAIVDYNKALAKMPAPPDLRSKDEIGAAATAAEAANEAESAKNEAANKAGS